MKGNKGEWSEVYALLKIIADKTLYGGDKDLNKVDALIFPIIRVLRDESNGTFSFSYEDDLVVIERDNEVCRINIQDFQSQAYALLSKLQEKTTTTFEIPEVMEFLNSFGSNSIKAKSTVKSDIRIVIHDHRTGITPELGFSIKSKLGSPSTLLNAGKTTNFIYKINLAELDRASIETINAIDTRSKIKDRIDAIVSRGGNLAFESTENTIFESNLVLIDSLLPKILGELLFYFFTSNLSKTSDLVELITERNPLNYNIKLDHPFYYYKVKRFLTDIALGMMPSKVWKGQLDATGGYLVVKQDGEVLCYHIYNRNEFEDYLFANTKLETASSTRHDFGIIYEENGAHYFKLNLQIRFL